MGVPRMRTIPESSALLKEMDEHTALTQCAIRRLVLDGKIKSVKAGRKILMECYHKSAVPNCKEMR